MKFLILAAFVVFASALSLKAPICDECKKKALGDLHTYLVGDEGLAAQIDILIAATCPDRPHESFPPGTYQCEANHAWYTPGFVTSTYKFFFTEMVPCGEMGLNVCERDWTCDECTGTITMLSEIMHQKNIKEAIIYLQGAAYCGNGDVHIPNCEDGIARYFVDNFSILSQGLVANAAGVCQIIAGVC